MSFIFDKIFIIGFFYFLTEWFSCFCLDFCLLDINNLYMRELQIFYPDLQIVSSHCIFFCAGQRLLSMKKAHFYCGACTSGSHAKFLMAKPMVALASSFLFINLTEDSRWFSAL